MTPMKWNTPIRSGASLEALILIKKHSWMFQGCLKPTKVISKFDDIEIIEEQIHSILKRRDEQ